MKPLQVVILAGGLGTRLRPITSKIPKVMVEIGDKPFLQYQFEYLKNQGFNDFLLLLSYLGEQVENYFQDGKQLKINIQYAYEPEPMGTGGALKLAQNKIREEFLLLNGDTFCPLDYPDFLHKARGISEGGMIAVYKNWEPIAENNMRLEEGGLISAYSKAKETKEMNGVDGGIAYYRRTVLNAIPADKKISFEDEIYPQLIKKKVLWGYFTNTRYYDMGTFERLEIAKKALSHDY
ncbi:MAG: hypothetical protein A2W61_05625 [Deltaproteobacteria bacterium RIFCSPLOWO2_01_44_7]|nr:MAG: hypothetical protein A2712_02985 [Deltaproteobacteria bacterium RIFCSPHIGHO2_01_FULL_43_49]OGQ16159.1 MAG: hypothetical protein A3D22_00955 [Deltaproteobacteria bacterium RIFCSPHIGHO2_02_FULL_44_53]OGQ29120.1 MAG: hypothetical protein A3D98_04740 [Deltaproteobacteria bacterium RIFCSPHIGHO2_12_FULL_44_21]OGQ32676.1 MAG: hypothetical protein A2979_08885 [Deltaproteobacteria bacterium RIFCSPLOWO2_01_FULL_45_74]OGQ37539.1 MAG: hypothetical protein A2W61_05625 [Deltaproteobacteria bacterium 